MNYLMILVFLITISGCEEEYIKLTPLSVPVEDNSSNTPIDIDDGSSDDPINDKVVLSKVDSPIESGKPVIFSGVDSSKDIATYEFKSSLDGELCSGTNSLCMVTDLSVGIHIISLIGTDSSGEKFTTIQVLTVEGESNTTEPQKVALSEINEPVKSGETVVLSGEESDSDIVSYEFKSSLDGELCSGTNSLCMVTDLSVGIHIISLIGTDSSGEEFTTIQVLTVEGESNTTEPQEDNITIIPDNEQNSTIEDDKNISSEDGSKVEDNTTTVPDNEQNSTIEDDKNISSEDNKTVIDSSITAILDIAGDKYLSDETIPMSAEKSESPYKIEKYRFSSDKDGILCIGVESTCKKSLSIGFHQITLKIENILGFTSSDTSSILVANGNSSPIARLSIAKSSYIDGDSIMLDGSESIDDKGIVNYKFSSDIDGELCNSIESKCSVETLKVGDHNITLIVEDDSKDFDSISKEVTVKRLNYPPVAVLNMDKTTLDEETPLLLDGSESVDDLKVESYSFYSSIDGLIYSGEEKSFVVDTLSAGKHTITLSIEDEESEEANDSKEVTVIPKNIEPVAKLTLESLVKFSSESITLNGSSSIDEDGNITKYEFNSSLDGELYSGIDSEFETSELSVGEHTITLTITDDRGATSSDSGKLEIVSKDMNLTISGYIKSRADRAKEGIDVNLSFERDNEQIVFSTTTDESGAFKFTDINGTEVEIVTYNDIYKSEPIVKTYLSSEEVDEVNITVVPKIDLEDILFFENGRKFTWDNAQLFGEYNGYRLLTKEELIAFLDEKEFVSDIAEKFGNSEFWSSTIADSTDLPYFIDFENGYILKNQETINYKFTAFIESGEEPIEAKEYTNLNGQAKWDLATYMCVNDGKVLPSVEELKAIYFRSRLPYGEEVDSLPTKEYWTRDSSDDSADMFRVVGANEDYFVEDDFEKYNHKYIICVESDSFNITANNIKGKVVKEGGVKLSGATVHLQKVESYGMGSEKSVISDADGDFAFGELNQGRYVATASSSDYIPKQKTVDIFSNGVDIGSFELLKKYVYEWIVFNQDNYGGSAKLVVEYDEGGDNVYIEKFGLNSDGKALVYIYNYKDVKSLYGEYANGETTGKITDFDAKDKKYEADNLTVFPQNPFGFDQVYNGCSQDAYQNGYCSIMDFNVNGRYDIDTDSWIYSVDKNSRGTIDMTHYILGLGIPEIQAIDDSTITKHYQGVNGIESSGKLVFQLSCEQHRGNDIKLPFHIYLENGEFISTLITAPICK